MRSQERGRGRHEQLLRVLAIIRELDRVDGLDLYDLAERHGTNVRTIRRDLDAIAAAGLPLAKERDGKRMRWRVVYRDRLSNVASLLDLGHYLGLKLAIEQSGIVRRASSVYAGLEDLAARIETAIGPADRKRLQAIEKYVVIHDKFPYREPTREYFLPLIDAMADSRVCRVTYRAPRPDAREATFDVLPLRLFLHDQAAYVICQFIRYGSIGTLNLQRVRRLVVLRRRADPPSDFDPTKYELAAFRVHPGEKVTTYVLRFSREAAPYIRERLWHPSQTLRDLHGGGVELTFTCGDSSEIATWVAGWQGSVTVVRPAGLRRELVRFGRWLMRTYKDGAGGSV